MYSRHRAHLAEIAVILRFSNSGSPAFTGDSALDTKFCLTSHSLIILYRATFTNVSPTYGKISKTCNPRPAAQGNALQNALLLLNHMEFQRFTREFCSQLRCQLNSVRREFSGVQRLHYLEKILCHHGLKRCLSRGRPRRPPSRVPSLSFQRPPHRSHIHHTVN